MSDELRYEDAAEPVKITNADGSEEQAWKSKSRGPYKGMIWTGPDAEHYARYQNATSHPCDSLECKSRAEKGRMFCSSCTERVATAKWDKFLAEKGVDWNGELPVAQDDGDKFFFDADSLDDYVQMHLAEGNDIDTLRLRLCEPENGPHFEMNEFLQDLFPEDGEVDSKEIDDAVNKWIESHAPFCWLATGAPIRPESLRNIFVERNQESAEGTKAP